MTASRLRRAMVQEHLTHNCYPPVGAEFTDAAIEAIAAMEAENPDKRIVLPNGVVLTAQQISDQVHLHHFFTEPDDDDM